MAAAVPRDNPLSQRDSLTLEELVQYGASKAALEAVTDSLRREAAPLGIKAFIVEPGSFRTAFYDDALRGSQVKIGDYDQTSGKTRKENLVNTHQQPGDPRKGGAGNRFCQHGGHR